MTETALLKIEEIVRVVEANSENLLAFSLDEPKPGTEQESTVLEFAGWVLGKTVPAVAVELLSGGSLFRTIPLDQTRSDVAKRYSKGPSFISSGFRTTIDISGLPQEEELLVQAVFRDETRIPLVWLQLRHQFLQTTSNAIVSSQPPGERLALQLEQVRADLERSKIFLEKAKADLS